MKLWKWKRTQFLWQKSYLIYREKINGFSLIELIITLSLISALLLISTPLSQAIISRNRSNTTINQLITAIHYARSEAIKLNSTITFCGSSNHKTCDGIWSKGQIVTNNINQQVLRIYPAITGNASLKWYGNFGEKNLLEFTGTGFTAGQSGSFHYCPDGKNLKYARAITVGLSGRLRVSSTGTKNRPLQCSN